jgi:hypothetical protein
VGTESEGGLMLTLCGYVVLTIFLTGLVAVLIKDWR